MVWTQYIMAGKLEADIIKQFVPDLITAISDIVTVVSDHCLAKGLISESTSRRMLESSTGREERARTIVHSIIGCIKTDSSCFEIFLEILNEVLPFRIKEKLVSVLKKELDDRSAMCKSVIPLSQSSQPILLEDRLQCIQQQSSFLDKFENSVSQRASASTKKSLYEETLRGTIDESRRLRTKLDTLSQCDEANSLNDREIQSTRNRLSTCEAEMTNLRQRIEELECIIEEESMRARRGRNVLRVETKRLLEEFAHQSQDQLTIALRNKEQEHKQILIKREAEIQKKIQEEMNLKIKDLEHKVALQEMEIKIKELELNNARMKHENKSTSEVITANSDTLPRKMTERHLVQHSGDEEFNGLDIGPNQDLSNSSLPKPPHYIKMHRSKSSETINNSYRRDMHYNPYHRGSGRFYHPPGVFMGRNPHKGKESRFGRARSQERVSRAMSQERVYQSPQFMFGYHDDEDYSGPIEYYLSQPSTFYEGSGMPTAPPHMMMDYGYDRRFSMHGPTGYTLSQPTNFIPSLEKKVHFSSHTLSGGGESFERNDGKNSEEEDDDDSEYGNIHIVELHKGEEPLGIKLTHYSSPDGKDLGVLIGAIDENGFAFKSGKLNCNDRLLACNGVDFTNNKYTVQQVQDIFYKMAQEEVLIRMAISRGISLPESNKGGTSKDRVTTENNNGGIDDNKENENKDEVAVRELLLPVASNHGDNQPEANENRDNESFVTNESSEGDKGKLQENSASGSLPIAISESYPKAKESHSTKESNIDPGGKIKEEERNEKVVMEPSSPVAVSASASVGVPVVVGRDSVNNTGAAVTTIVSSSTKKPKKRFPLSLKKLFN